MFLLGSWVYFYVFVLCLSDIIFNLLGIVIFSLVRLYWLIGVFYVSFDLFWVFSVIFVSLVPVCASEVSHAKFRTLNGKHASFTPGACSLTPGHFFFESLLYFLLSLWLRFLSPFFGTIFYLLGIVFVSVQCYFKFLCYYFLSFAYALSLSGIVLRFLGIFFYLYGDIVLTLWCILCFFGTDLFLSVYILRLLLIHFACLWCSFVPPKWAHLFIPSVINEPRYVQDFKWNTCLLHGLFHTLSVLI